MELVAKLLLLQLLLQNRNFPLNLGSVVRKLCDLANALGKDAKELEVLLLTKNFAVLSEPPHSAQASEVKELLGLPLVEQARVSKYLPLPLEVLATHVHAVPDKVLLQNDNELAGLVGYIALVGQPLDVRALFGHEHPLVAKVLPLVDFTNDFNHTGGALGLHNHPPREKHTAAIHRLALLEYQVTLVNRSELDLLAQTPQGIFVQPPSKVTHRQYIGDDVNFHVLPLLRSLEQCELNLCGLVEEILVDVPPTQSYLFLELNQVNPSVQLLLARLLCVPLTLCIPLLDLLLYTRNVEVEVSKLSWVHRMNFPLRGHVVLLSTL
mmetsp:Transcript_10110/g.20671  ORF Transcript_10110/g.20671 Transcript_10110/m.20671 type:complete len:323 (-) Transcript_10110:1603-2571(-)